MSPALSPSVPLVDLTATLRFPALPDAETPAQLAATARTAGFGTVVTAPVGPLTGADALLSFARHLGEDVLVPAPSPLRLSHAAGGKAELAEIYTLARAGVPVRALRLLHAVDDALLLRRALELARALDLVVMVPSTDAALAHGAVLVESAVSTRLGLPAVPESSEILGVSRIIELARITHARVHVAHLFTAAGVELLERAQKLGVRISGCASIAHLTSDESAHLTRPYDPQLRVWPPLPTAAGRRALVDGVKSGVLCASSGHTHVPKREKDLEMAVATPGQSTLATSWQWLLGVVDEKTALRAFATDPARILQPATGGAR